MCGICGVCLSDPAGQVDRALVEAMSARLAHRGPDGAGVYVDSRVGLGHRRLSIIDLNTGDQPMSSEDGTCVLVFNGEIYNYLELRRELTDQGHRFRTQSDTEVILHLYERHGADCVHRLNGMFAFALWDARARRLFAARDRLGEKPLYYCEQAGRLTFASELKALRCDPSFRPEISVEALDHYLAYGYVPAPYTIFEGVYKLPAGHRLTWQGGTLRTDPYWTVSFPPPSDLDEAAYVSELRRRLDHSVRIRLRSDVPVGAFLSGGIDSSVVVALASLQRDRPLETFSVGFAAEDYDESAFARMVAERYATSHHEIRVDALDLDVFEKLVEHFDEPFADPSAIPTYFVAREARKFVKVCLSGDGGDEVFAGYDQYALSRAARWTARIPAAVRRVAFGSAAACLGDHVRGKGWLRRMATSGARRYQREVGIFDGDERMALFTPDWKSAVRREPWLLEPYFANGHVEEVVARQHADQMTYLPEDILVKVDRTAMKSALEVRIPFLDHEVVEWVNAMPLAMKIRGSCRKYALRRVAEELLPTEVLTREKRGFGMPIKHWLRKDLDAFAEELLLSPISRSGAYFRPDVIRRIIGAHRRGGRNLSHRVWALLWFEQWCRQFQT